LEAGCGEAIGDFALRSKCHGEEAPDEGAFKMPLDDVGHAGDGEGPFNSFKREAGLASPSFDGTKRSVSVQDMKCLYWMEPCRLPRWAAFNSGKALMCYVECLFREADVTGDDILDKEGLRSFMGRLFEGREPTDKEMGEVSGVDISLFSFHLEVHETC